MKFIVEVPDNGGDLLKDHTPDELACAIGRQLEQLTFDNGDILYTHGVTVSAKSDFGLDLEALEDLARHYTGFSDEVEIDTLEPGDVSPGNDGIWVRAWVHLPNDSLDAAGIENPEAVRHDQEDEGWVYYSGPVPSMVENLDYIAGLIGSTNYESKLVPDEGWYIRRLED